MSPAVPRGRRVEKNIVFCPVCVCAEPGGAAQPQVGSVQPR